MRIRGVITFQRYVPSQAVTRLSLVPVQKYQNMKNNKHLQITVFTPASSMASSIVVSARASLRGAKT